MEGTRASNHGEFSNNKKESRRVFAHGTFLVFKGMVLFLKNASAQSPKNKDKFFLMKHTTTPQTSHMNNGDEGLGREDPTCTLI